MNKIVITLTQNQVRDSLANTARNIICSDKQYLKNPKVEIKEDGSAEVTAELERQAYRSFDK